VMACQGLVRGLWRVSLDAAEARRALQHGWHPACPLGLLRAHLSIVSLLDAEGLMSCRSRYVVGRAGGRAG
jgi:hypothetical protein